LFNRRRLLAGSAATAGVFALGACASFPQPPPRLRLAPVRATTDRLFDITCCLRPFRAAGPRLDTEQIGSTLVVHNYGHGGSGWSLSWGSSTLAVKKAVAASPRRIAVLGCGALGLTSATLAQQAGADVTIYSKDLLADTRSYRATGTWSPDSRIALENAIAPDFPQLWEEMARTSLKIYRRYLGLPGNPVEWMDRYTLASRGPWMQAAPSQLPELPFVSLRDRIADMVPHGENLAPDDTPFGPAAERVRRSSAMTFNIASYGHLLMSDFLAAGGRFVHREFHEPKELGELPEKVVINCPGYGARALWQDESIVPVRGQIGWLIPQPEVDYSLYYKDVSMIPRSDGIVVQALEGGDMRGYNDTDETPHRPESEAAVQTIAEVFANWG
jgi:glycine/D-amino acid oxidase-like deaminating enzyme